jgi:hypothetical protein
MIFHLSTVSFVAYFILILQPVKEVKLIPVDQGVQDRGSLSESFMVVPVDMRQDNSFEKLYRVEGSDGVYIRKAGGLRAVFKNPSYLDTKGGSVPLIPAGTVYSIGEIRKELLGQIEQLSDPPVPDSLIVPQEHTFASQEYPTRVTNTKRHSMRFINDESYRRTRLASLLLNIVLVEN